MKYAILFAGILLMAFTSPQKKKKVVFFGDSITQAGVNPDGYITKMDSLIKAEGQSANYELVGAGISGNKIYDLYLRVENDVLSKNPDVVVIYIGINDVWHKASSGTGTDLPKYIQFYKALIKKFTDKNIKVIVCTPTVIGERNDNSNQQDGDLNQYSKVIRSLADEFKLPLVDLRNAFAGYLQKNNPKNEEKGILTTDRVHLNNAGNLLVAQEMWKVIKQ
ncbi:SGNH/GDSL hydrolase family protein [Terrimonas rubra]|uniref:SGNH/GDSL hydrolase family protein n=1 Tax=Terrimonas rubra TaxID=1035890 RepID=A0ABW6A3X2_9BACT